MNQLSTQLYEVADSLYSDAMLIAHSEVALSGIVGANSYSRWSAPVKEYTLKVFKSLPNAWDFPEIEGHESRLGIRILNPNDRDMGDSFTLIEKETGLDLQTNSRNRNHGDFLLQLLDVSTPTEVLPFISHWTKDRVARISERGASLSTTDYLPQDRYMQDRLPKFRLAASAKRDPTTGETTRHVYWTDASYTLKAILSPEDAEPNLLQAYLRRVASTRSMTPPVPEYEAASALTDLRQDSAQVLDTTYDFMRKKYEISAQKHTDIATR